MAGVGEGDPHELDPGIARRAATGDDPDAVARVGDEAGVLADDLLDAADDRRRGVVEDGDRQARRGDPP
jgi:hypothetical protein